MTTFLLLPTRKWHQPSNPSDEISGTALIERLHQNISYLYSTLTNSAHPHALKLRNRLIITSHPQSPILYLCLADQEATGRTRAEQTSILDQISAHCLIEGKVAVVSTGAHVKKYLQLVPEPSLRLIANVSQTKDDVELLVRVLGEAVERVLVSNAGILWSRGRGSCICGSGTGLKHILYTRELAYSVSDLLIYIAHNLSAVWYHIILCFFMKIIFTYLV